MTPLDEMRADFEAKHDVPVFAEYNAQLNRYIAKHDAPQGQWTASVLKEYNALWQGYQSALEDRQGEAVATLEIAKHELKGQKIHYAYLLGLDCTENEEALNSPPEEVAKAFRALCKKLGPGQHKLFTSPQPAQSQHGEAVRYERLHPTQGWIIVEEQDIPHYREQGQQIRPLFTSPQPAQPDQWNAAIEAAADIVRKSALEAGSVENAQELRDCEARILALNTWNELREHAKGA